MPLPKTHVYSLEDIYNLPEGQRAELINGQLIDMAPPNRIHQKLVSELHHAVLSYIKSCNGSCEIYPAPFMVFLNRDEGTYVEPDISVICDKSKLTDQGCEGAPDFIIEVISPGSRSHDYITKNKLYSDAGVREYWIVDPLKQCTTVYHYEKDAAPMIFPFSQSVTAAIYGNLQITIADLLTSSDT